MKADPGTFRCKPDSSTKPRKSTCRRADILNNGVVAGPVDGPSYLYSGFQIPALGIQQNGCPLNLPSDIFEPESISIEQRPFNADNWGIPSVH
ncbi:hypothetical protein MesoLjLb_18800 [Mesorhizobium sp. L-8-3]|nr:hypothetical protein MesoLjLb_18800 [Mesorhizobium sp. L-8-3]